MDLAILKRLFQHSGAVMLMSLSILILLMQMMNIAVAVHQLNDAQHADNYPCLRFFLINFR